MDEELVKKLQDLKVLLEENTQNEEHKPKLYKKITNEELEEKFKLHKLWLDRDPVGVIADLRSANLSNANLEDADLTGAFLVFADLTAANLTGAWIGHASFLNAKLNNVNFNGVNSMECAYFNKTSEEKK